MLHSLTISESAASAAQPIKREREKEGEREREREHTNLCGGKQRGKDSLRKDMQCEYKICAMY